MKLTCAAELARGLPAASGAQSSRMTGRMENARLHHLATSFGWWVMGYFHTRRYPVLLQATSHNLKPDHDPSAALSAVVGVAVAGVAAAGAGAAGAVAVAAGVAAAGCTASAEKMPDSALPLTVIPAPVLALAAASSHADSLLMGALKALGGSSEMERDLMANAYYAQSPGSLNLSATQGTNHFLASSSATHCARMVPPAAPAPSAAASPSASAPARTLAVGSSSQVALDSPRPASAAASGATVAGVDSGSSSSPLAALATSCSRHRIDGPSRCYLYHCYLMDMPHFGVIGHASAGP
jgi:hypothetical protein